MTERDQIAAFEKDLDALVSRYCEEFDLAVASAVGVLEIKKQALIAQALEQDEE